MIKVQTKVTISEIHPNVAKELTGEKDNLPKFISFIGLQFYFHKASFSNKVKQPIFFECLYFEENYSGIDNKDELFVEYKKLTGCDVLYNTRIEFDKYVKERIKPLCLFWNDTEYCRLACKKVTNEFEKYYKDLATVQDMQRYESVTDFFVQEIAQYFYHSFPAATKLISVNQDPITSDCYVLIESDTCELTTATKFASYGPDRASYFTIINIHFCGDFSGNKKIPVQINVKHNLWANFFPQMVNTNDNSEILPNYLMIKKNYNQKLLEFEFKHFSIAKNKNIPYMFYWETAEEPELLQQQVAKIVLQKYNDENELNCETLEDYFVKNIVEQFPDQFWASRKS